MTQAVCILGVTGSIGQSTLKVLEQHPDQYNVFAVSAYSRLDELLKICKQHRPKVVVVPNEKALELKQLFNQENLINIETSNAWSQFQSSKSVLEATKAQLKAAEIANEGITLEYDSGNTRTTLELIQSRSLLLDARISFARAERDFVVSQFELAKQIGTLSVNSLK